MKFIITLLITVCTKALIAQTILNGLIGYYNFSGNANDLSSSSNNGTVHGAILGSDRLGNANSAYSFDGVDDYINISATNLQLNQYTYKMWIWNVTPASGGDRETGISIGSATGDQFINNANNYVGGGGVIYDGWGGGGYNTDGTTSSSNALYDVSKNIWACMVLTRSLDSVKFYVDGDLKFAVALNGKTPFYGTGTVQANIGARHDLTLPFSGKIDDVEIFNRALSQAEVNAVCDANTGVKDIKANEPFFVLYPNPSNTGSFNLIYKNNSNKDFTMEITNILGQKIFETNKASIANNTIQLPENTGVFFCTIRCEGKMYTQKLICE